MLISERVFQLMKEQKMTQKEFSIQTGIPQSTISDWKGKKLNPSADKIMVICRVLKVSPTELLTGFSEDAGASSVDKAPENYVIVNKDTDEYRVMTTYHELDADRKSRVIGYLHALTEK